MIFIKPCLLILVTYMSGCSLSEFVGRRGFLFSGRPFLLFSFLNIRCESLLKKVIGDREPHFVPYIMADDAAHCYFPGRI